MSNEKKTFLSETKSVEKKVLSKMSSQSYCRNLTRHHTGKPKLSTIMTFNVCNYFNKQTRIQVFL